jgi:hypothetical protein
VRRTSSRNDPARPRYSITFRYAHALPRPGRRKATECSFRSSPSTAPRRQEGLTTGCLTGRGERRPALRSLLRRGSAWATLRDGRAGYNVSFRQFRTCRRGCTGSTRANCGHPGGAASRCNLPAFGLRLCNSTYGFNEELCDWAEGALFQNDNCYRSSRRRKMNG